MSVFGIGIDLLSSERVARLYSSYGARLLRKVLSPRELALLEREESPVRRIGFVAKRFSAKEALLKALGIGLGRGIGLTDVSVLGGSLGQPTIEVSEAAKMFLQKFYGLQDRALVFSLSISDEGSLVSAVVVISTEAARDF
ncbi:MAG: holo-ACP synthase [Rickettsiales bacterium]|jgi:holo-[acyl-carrier protein] synthase|nr:holo-ACP synthase [Rickettsiales bacterium]